MDLLAGIKTYLFLLSSCLLYPVLVLLAALSLWSFFECGRLLAAWIRRKRLAPGADSAPVAAYRAAVGALLAGKASEVDIQNFLRRSIQEQEARLDKYRLAVRIGPALGLAGTLVPMGTALASLGQGDFSVMTGELVVAYTTTVVGLLVGSLAYVVYTVRRRFTEADIREMEHLTEVCYDEVHAE